MRFTWLTLIFLLAFPACSSEEVSSPNTNTIITAEHLEEIELTSGIQTIEIGPTSSPLRLTISVPDPVPTENVPLLLALHWAGTGSPNLARQYVEVFAEPGFRNLGAIIIAPEATTTFWTGTDVARTLSSLVNAAVETWPVNPDQVVATGYSMGGVGTWYIISLYPELFCAAIPMAGEPTAVLNPSVPLLAIHGEQDEIYPLIATETAITALLEMGGTAELLVGPGLSHGQVGAYFPYIDQAITWLEEQIFTNH